MRGREGERESEEESQVAERWGGGLSALDLAGPKDQREQEAVPRSRFLLPLPVDLLPIFPSDYPDYPDYPTVY
ncbi:hypothetical protein [Thermogemmatispora onikobensis]|uniref:hypothetical protein n=1 Tax=Thermogemmatispora onikobensis TaxID=732234 RepID=UPI000853E6D5|nr:hypothetical protein [Thermogemmatispora onikobensis]